MLPLAPLVLAPMLALNTVAPNTAYTEMSPVQIAACSVDPIIARSGGDAVTEQQIGSELHVRFMNNGPTTASSVTFAVTNGNQSWNVTDRGTFTSGVAISHWFAAGRQDFATPTCHVSSVEFVDGRLWTEANGFTAVLTPKAPSP